MDHQSLPETMSAAIYGGPEAISLQTRSVPRPDPGYVVLRTSVCGVCGSDLHVFAGRWKQTEAAGGHEVAGVVAALGAGVESVSVGERVCVECFTHCGRCEYCRSGMYNHCLQRGGTSGGAHAGFAEYTVAHESSLVKVPEELSDEDAAMVEPVAVAYRAVARSRASHRDKTAVVGCGSIGLLIVGVAKAIGLADILAFAKHPHQAEAATRMGASLTLQPGDDTAKDMDVVIETTGSEGGLMDAIGMIRPGGTIVLLGGYHAPVSTNVSRIVVTEAWVTGSNCYGQTGMKRDFEWAIELIRRQDIRAAEIVTHRFGLSDIEEAFATASKKETGSIKVHVVMDGGDG